MSLRSLVLGLLLGLALGAAAVDGALRRGMLRRAPSGMEGMHMHGGAGVVDWSQVSSQDLDVAALFITVRGAGLRSAMDSLDALGARNRRILLMGHAVAHGLGRFAVTAHPHDRSLFAQCSPAFNSGCYHGVMEGYLAEPGDHPPPSALCDSISGGTLPPYVRRECAHGLGHALMGMNGGRTEPSLRGCDQLHAGEERSDCWEGVYMEDLLRAVNAPVFEAGDSAVARRARTRTVTALGSCDGAPATYRAACWAYQPVLALSSGKLDARHVIASCRAAPDPASRQSCWRGYGKQSAGLMLQRPDTLATLCALDGADAVADCLDGAVEYHVEHDWRAGDGRSFCAALPAGVQGSCYASVGAHAALIYPPAAAADSVCAPVPAAYAADCRRGAAAPRS